MDKPILFSAPMIRALLEGRKTQTRRVLKPQPPAWAKVHQSAGDGWEWVDRDADSDNLRHWPDYYKPMRPPYTPGDRLWVREAYRLGRGYDHVAPGDAQEFAKVWYAADESIGNADAIAIGKPRPSIHMPRWASRLTLVVTDVRVQRVQEISEEDAKAEGIYKSEPTAADLEWYREWAPQHGVDPAKEPMQGVWMVPGTRQGWGMTKAEREKERWAPDPKFGFKLLWDSINAKRGYGWGENPWVAAITFTVHKVNVDALAGEPK